MLRFQVTFQDAGVARTLTTEAQPQATVGSLLQKLLRSFGAQEAPDGWELVYQGKPLELSRTLGASFGISSAKPIELILRRSAQQRRQEPESFDELLPGEEDLDLSARDPIVEDLESGVGLDAPSETADAFDLFLEDVDVAGAESADSDVDLIDVDTFELDMDEPMVERSEPVPPPPPAPSAPPPSAQPMREQASRSAAPAAVAPRAKAVPSVSTTEQKVMVEERRATVRYYTRMNPQRAHPFLVMITKHMIEKSLKKGTTQGTSGPFKVDAEAALEIEPILPGCDCYPPKVVTRLGKEDLHQTFYVVPHVLGKVEGATVIVRQNNVVLTEIELDIRVAQRTIVTVMGCLTILVPFVSALVGHFGVDLRERAGEEIGLYLGVLDFCLNNTSPFMLTMLLGMLTGMAHWFTRPTTKDVFWEVKTTTPEEMLRKVVLLAETDPYAASELLMELLKAYPGHQPARVYFAHWHYRQGNYAEALAAFEIAISLGTMSYQDYIHASAAASRTGDHQKALDILGIAERALPSHELGGVLYFNKGCYLARLGRLDEVIPVLRTALVKGYRKVEQYLKDPDLNPVRRRAEFQSLLAELRG